MNSSEILQKTVQILSSKWGIEVVVGGTECCTDGKVIRIPTFISIDEGISDIVLGAMDHETSHVIFCDFEAFKQIKKQLIFDLANIFEDKIDETKYKNIYPGSKFFLESLDSFVRQKVEVERWFNLSELDIFLYNISKYFNEKKTIGERSELLKEVIPLLDSADSINSTKEAIELAEKVYKRIKETYKDKVKDKKGQDEFRDYLIKTKKEERSKYRTIISPSGYISELSKEQLKQNLEYKKEGNARSLPTTTKYDLILITPKLPEVYNKHKKFLQDAIYSNISKAEMAFQTKRRISYKREQTKGLVDLDSLFKYVAYNDPNILKTLDRARGLDTAILLMPDYSASMLGDKTKLSKDVQIVFAELLSFLNVPHAIIGHNTGYCPQMLNLITIENRQYFNRLDHNLKIHIIKSFEDTNAYGIPAIYPNDENCDGEAMQYSVDLIRNRPEKRKIILSLSDGCPAIATSDYELLGQDLRRVIEEAQDIEIIGIGFLDNNVARFYKKYILVEDKNEAISIIIGKVLDLLIKVN